MVAFMGSAVGADASLAPSRWRSAAELSLLTIEGVAGVRERVKRHGPWSRSGNRSGSQSAHRPDVRGRLRTVALGARKVLIWANTLEPVEVI